MQERFDDNNKHITIFMDDEKTFYFYYEYSDGILGLVKKGTIN